VLKTLLNRFIARMERRWRYDAGYMHRMADISPTTALKFAIVTSLVDRRAAPPEAIAAAGLAGTLAEDCGPCTQLGVDMAAAAGVSPAVLRAILAGDGPKMGETAALAYDFAQAVLAHDVEADRLRDEIVERWGEKALAALALAITTARMYPTLKYGMGYGKACAKVSVAGASVPFSPPARLVAGAV
jgi:hypothetical protein